MKPLLYFTTIQSCRFNAKVVALDAVVDVPVDSVVDVLAISSQENNKKSAGMHPASVTVL